MTMDTKDTFAIIGLGKAGTAIGCLLRRAGFNIVAVAGRSLPSLQERMLHTGGKAFTADRVSEAASLASCIFITTPDDSILSVCNLIAEGGGFKPGDKVIHMSGAGGLNLLEPAQSAGADVACIHPIQSFADVEGAISNIPHSTFGITADGNLREWCSALVRVLGGIPFNVPENIKPLYHAAACMASNYLTTLIHIVEQIYLSLGLSSDEAINAFWPLMEGTMKNIERQGSIRALTGPISRGDAGTIDRHITVFKEELPRLLPVYRVLGLQTVELSLKKKTISPEIAEKIINILKGE